MQNIIKNIFIAAGKSVLQTSMKHKFEELKKNLNIDCEIVAKRVNVIFRGKTTTKAWSFECFKLKIQYQQNGLVFVEVSLIAIMK